MTDPGSRWTPLDLGVRFDARPYRLSVGVHRLDLDAWLLADDLRADELRLKHRLLAEHRDTVVAALPSSAEASGELLELVIDAVTTAGLVGRRGHTLVDRASGIEVVVPDLHPIDAAGRLIQEDLCVMEQRNAEWILTAGSVCFPSRWSLAEKLGRTVSEIHRPVPGFGRIDRATELAMDRIATGDPMTRANWTLIDDPALFQPAVEADHGSEAEMSSVPPLSPRSADSFALRIERQTLRSLPASGALAFTIRTVVLPLEWLGAQESAALAATLGTVDRSTMAYKAWEGRLTEVMHKLTAHSAEH